MSEKVYSAFLAEQRIIVYKTFDAMLILVLYIIFEKDFGLASVTVLHAIFINHSLVIYFN